MVNPLARPPKNPLPKPNPPATARPNSAAMQSPVRPGQGNNQGGNRGGGDHRGGGNNQGGNHQNPGNNNQPSPWLEHPSDPIPRPDNSASFVEYLRWMREVCRNQNRDGKDPTDPATKVQILQLAEEKADYQDRLEKLNERTRLIAGQNHYFEVTSSWRIRVGGHRGPESILLPAFDALGMPYIPSSTLRGVARTQAIREFMDQDGLTWKEAEKLIAPYFGSLDASNNADKAGKVIFLDAYPIPNHGKCGLEVDMANNIWSWSNGNNLPEYSPNPNPFFSLKKSKFLIGIKPTGACDTQTFNQVKQWLINGLTSGIGSQVNTGYGVLTTNNQVPQGFLQVDFTLEGQLIHGCQKFTQLTFKNDKWQTRGNPDPEVRSVAFKSMLRYWFRAFALGVLPVDIVKNLEAEIFGSINPQKRGYLVVRIDNDKLVKKEAKQKNDDPGEQSGTLILDYSTEINDNQKQPLTNLAKNLTWLMFHLGGIGQGARRPCYSRNNRQYAPWWRGSTLIPESEHEFWDLPETPQAMQTLFRQRLQQFYQALNNFTTHPVNSGNLRQNGVVRNNQWSQAVDTNCQIFVCTGKAEFGKPCALAQLHHENLKKTITNKQNKQEKIYDPDLCGTTSRKNVKPSPIWISNIELDSGKDYQIVTVFGATQAPRSTYLDNLKKNTQACLQIFPFNKKIALNPMSKKIHHIFISLVGSHDPIPDSKPDQTKETQNDKGSIISLIEHLIILNNKPEQVHLLHTTDEKFTKNARDTAYWLIEELKEYEASQITLHPVSKEFSDDPIRQALAIQEARTLIDQLELSPKNNYQLEFNASSGTPAMKTVWGVLQATGYLKTSSRIWQVRNPNEMKTGQSHIFENNVNPLRAEIELQLIKSQLKTFNYAAALATYLQSGLAYNPIIDALLKYGNARLFLDFKSADRILYESKVKCEYRWKKDIKILQKNITNQSIEDKKMLLREGYYNAIVKLENKHYSDFLVALFRLQEHLLNLLIFDMTGLKLTGKTNNTLTEWSTIKMIDNGKLREFLDIYKLPSGDYLNCNVGISRYVKLGIVDYLLGKSADIPSSVIKSLRLLDDYCEKRNSYVHEFSGISKIDDEQKVRECLKIVVEFAAGSVQDFPFHQLNRDIEEQLQRLV
ncbi:RAMP superfamily CRISPR-associated protein [Thermosynechococcaceae cyanobacterium BACA0444]|uniref:RAMP superfamily CRISPR-associated protein n=1 Tax=Pseudocalidococcus azoricus BACA0444 TaxID=2918990 RepID=A0AAE4FT30_9CYAN|nr:RAMP superfamily CRISPR-associated protein [Pseudocalidococcus azoricus]MDS3861710.1 RAMP superfamily CRISPR-associated protein [Pseudocalidococcus azoricus BACA0444]